MFREKIKIRKFNMSNTIVIILMKNSPRDKRELRIKYYLLNLTQYTANIGSEYNAYQATMCVTV